MKKNKFDAVLFDIDGTILDTREFIFQAYKYTISRHLNEDISWEQVAPTLGLSLQKCYQILTGLTEVENLMKTHDDFQYQNLDLIVAYPNTLLVLKQLQKAKIKIGAVTNRYGEQVKKSLEITSIGKYFEVVITPMEVKNPKPDAEPVLLALQLLKIANSKTIFIGDSPVDIQAGKEAGCKTIGATHGYFGPKLAETKPDFLVSDISGILPIVLG